MGTFFQTVKWKAKDKVLLENSGGQPVWRFLVTKCPVIFSDLSAKHDSIPPPSLPVKSFETMADTKVPIPIWHAPHFPFYTEHIDYCTLLATHMGAEKLTVKSRKIKWSWVLTPLNCPNEPKVKKWWHIWDDLILKMSRFSVQNALLVDFRHV